MIAFPLTVIINTYSKERIKTMDVLDMTRKSFEFSEYVKRELSCGITVCYRLCVANTEKRPVYSILISQYDNGELSEEEFLFDVASEAAEAHRIFRSFYEDCVLPYTVRECFDSLSDVG